MTKDDSTEDFAALLKEFDEPQKQRRRSVQVGERIRGKIVSIGRDAVFVSLGLDKGEATLDLVELADGDGKVTAKVGDEIEAVVASVEGRADNIVLRRAFGRGAASAPERRADLAQAFQLGLPVEGTVTAVNKGGVEVQVAGLRGFCPISQLEARHVDDAAPYVGRNLTFRISRYETDARGVNLVLSRRALLEEEARARAGETRAKLALGTVLPGVVTAIKDYGAFVDIGGLEGMLHVSEIAYQRGIRPDEVLTVGQRLQVQVIKIESTGDPKRPERIGLSIKSLERDPWDDVAERFGAGAKLTGRIMRLEPFGAFVEVAPGIEGLVHIGELAGGKTLRHAREAAKIGDTLEVTVLSIDRERRRMSLGVGDRPEAVDPADLANARANVPARLGTLGDLLKQSATKTRR